MAGDSTGRHSRQPGPAAEPGAASQALCLCVCFLGADRGAQKRRPRGGKSDLWEEPTGGEEGGSGEQRRPRLPPGQGHWREEPSAHHLFLHLSLQRQAHALDKGQGRRAGAAHLLLLCWEGPRPQPREERAQARAAPVGPRAQWRCSVRTRQGQGENGSSALESPGRREAATERRRTPSRRRLSLCLGA